MVGRGRRPTPSVPVSVNLSAHQLRNPKLVDDITKLVVDGLELAPEMLKLEITETALIENAEVAADALRKLRQPPDSGTHRRLRYRVLLAELPASAEGRWAQDRPLVRGEHDDG